jgi:hypothetical protein
VSPLVLFDRPYIRKTVLATEWLEVMAGFVDKGRPHKRVLNQVDLILLFRSLRLPAHWQNNRDELLAIEAALRLLLVSEESLHEMAEKDLNFKLRDLRKLIQANHSEAMQRLWQLVHRFSEKWSVESPLVIERLREVAFGGPQLPGDGNTAP